MRQTGIVKETNRNMAKVEIKRGSACGENCASCGLCPGQSAQVFALNNIGAAVGDTVVINMSDKKVIGAAFLVYIVPLIALVSGYFAGHAVFGKELYGILGGFIFMAVSFCAIAAADMKLKEKYTPRVEKIIKIPFEISSSADPFYSNANIKNKNC